MTFKDRQAAGKQLAIQLEKYSAIKNGIVIGLPRGGVIPAAEVATHLHLPLDIVITRKIGAPGHAEFAIGAITQDGQPVLDNDVITQYGVDQNYIDTTIANELAEAKRRIQTYRKGKSPLKLHNKIVLLIDDGIATGYTMLAAVKYIRSQRPKKIIVAIPVAAPEALEKVSVEVDEIICLQPELLYGAVGASYASFDQTSDAEVLKLLSR